MKPQRSQQGKKSMKTKFFELLEQSIIVQSILTVMLSATVCTMYLVPMFRGVPMKEIEIPGALLTLTGAIIGYWFKAKEQFAAKAQSPS